LKISATEKAFSRIPSVTQQFPLRNESLKYKGFFIAFENIFGSFEFQVGKS